MTELDFASGLEALGYEFLKDVIIHEGDVLETIYKHPATDIEFSYYIASETAMLRKSLGTGLILTTERFYPRSVDFEPGNKMYKYETAMIEALHFIEPLHKA